MFPGISLAPITHVNTPHYVKTVCSNRAFLGAAGIGAAPTVACSSSSTAAAPTNGTVGAAGNTSRPYKCHARGLRNSGLHLPPPPRSIPCPLSSLSPTPPPHPSPVASPSSLPPITPPPLPLPLLWPPSPPLQARPPPLHRCGHNPLLSPLRSRSRRVGRWGFHCVMASSPDPLLTSSPLMSCPSSSCPRRKARVPHLPPPPLVPEALTSRRREPRRGRKGWCGLR